MPKKVNLPTTARKDIQRWLLASFGILAVVVAVVVVAGGGKKTQTAPSPLAREGADSLQRRFCYYCKTHALTGVDRGGVKGVDDGTAHRASCFHLWPKHEAVEGKSISARLKQLGERDLRCGRVIEINRALVKNIVFGYLATHGKLTAQSSNFFNAPS